MGWTSDEAEADPTWEDWFLEWERNSRPPRYSDRTAAEAAEARRQGVPPGQPPEAIPLIIETALGGDPGELLALFTAAVTSPQLSLVITADDPDGQRARFARYFLHAAQRGDVEVAVGAATGPERQRPFVIPEATFSPVTAEQSRYPISAAAKVLYTAAGAVHWVGLSSLTNLASTLAVLGDQTHLFRLFQLGGAPPPRPIPADDNLALDVGSTERVLETASRPVMVSSLIAADPELQLTPGAPLTRLIAESTLPGADIVSANIAAWDEQQSAPADARQLATWCSAISQPFVELYKGEQGGGVSWSGERLKPTDPHFGFFLESNVNASALLTWTKEQLAAAAKHGVSRRD